MILEGMILKYFIPSESNCFEIYNKAAFCFYIFSWQNNDNESCQ